jgi:hypothetical protein
MTPMTATVRDGRLEFPCPIDLPDGTEIEIRLPEQTGADSGREDDVSMTPDEIARTLAAMEKVEPLEMSDEERATLETDRQARKEWEKAHFEAHAEKLQRIWE